MKFQPFIVAAVVLAIGACKPTYKATDRPRSATDSTATAVDTTGAINKMPVSTDSANMPKMDSVRMDSTSQPLPDSAKISTATDSIRMQPATDSAASNTELDSSRIQPATDSVNTTPLVDSSAASSQAPAIVEPVFTKQYPDATNAVWSAYDSLAAVPIDLRMAGWKKMDAQDHMVKFDFKDQTYYAWYDSEGKWIGSAYTMEDLTKLPAAVNTAVNNAIKARYKDYNVTQVNREMKPGNKSAYEVELAKDNSKVRMLVTPAGKITQIFKYQSK